MKHSTRTLLAFLLTAVLGLTAGIATAGPTDLAPMLPGAEPALCDFISNHNRTFCTLTCGSAGVACTIHDGRLSVCGVTLSSGEFERFVVSHNVCG